MFHLSYAQHKMPFKPFITKQGCTDTIFFSNQVRVFSFVYYQVKMVYLHKKINIYLFIYTLSILYITQCIADIERVM